LSSRQLCFRSFGVLVLSLRAHIPDAASDLLSTRLALRSSQLLRRLVQMPYELTLPATMALYSLDKGLRIEFGAFRISMSIVFWEVSLRFHRSEILEQSDRIAGMVNILDLPKISNLLRIIGKRPTTLQRIARPVIARNHARDDRRSFLGFDVGDHLIEIPAESVHSLVDASLSEDCDSLAADSRQCSSVFHVGGRIDVVVVAHFDEDVVACFSGGEES
jgi:hypothetical protein